MGEDHRPAHAAGPLTEPVDGVYCALKHGEEGVGDPVRQPLRELAQVIEGQNRATRIEEPHLCVIRLASAEQGLQGVVCWDNEASYIDQEMSGDVEENEEEVKGSEAKDGVDLGYGGLPFKVVEGGVFGELRCRRRQ